MTEEATRLEFAQQSYREVLDATKHQDDKIGRFLGAIAFLIAGSLVFFSPAVLATRYRLRGDELPLGAWSLGAFLFMVALSVLLLVLTLATPLTLPIGHSERPLGSSHIYFISIAGETEQSWKRMWPTVLSGDFSATLEEEYIAETRNIAERVDRKNARTREGVTLFIGAMIFFALTAFFSVDAMIASRAKAQEPVTIPWNQARRIVVGVILGSVSGLMLYYQFRSGQKLKDAVTRRVARDRHRAAGPPSSVPAIRAIARRLRRCHRGVLGWARGPGSVGALALVWPIFVFATIVGNGRRGWLVSGAPVVLVAGTVAVWLFAYKRARDGWAAWAPGAMLGTAVVLSSVVAISKREVAWQLVVGVVAVLLPLAANLVDATLVMRRRVAAHTSGPART